MANVDSGGYPKQSIEDIVKNLQGDKTNQDDDKSVQLGMPPDPNEEGLEFDEVKPERQKRRGKEAELLGEEPEQESEEEIQEESETVEEEKPEPKKEEKQEKPEDDDREKEMARLAYERREAKKQLRLLQEENERLRGEKPELTSDEQIQQQIRIEADRLYNDRVFGEKTKLVAEKGFKDFNDFGLALSGLGEVTTGGITRAVTEAVLETDIPEKVVYYLGKNLHEYERIVALSPVQMASAVLKIATKLTPAPTPPTPPKPVSKAPPPIKTISGPAKAAKEESFEDYVKNYKDRRQKEPGFR